MDTLRITLGLLLALHALIHLVGFAVPWRLAEIRGVPYATTAVWDTFELGAAGAKILGVVWLGVAVVLLVAAGGMFHNAPWVLNVAMPALAVSLAACFLGSPASSPGIVANLFLITMIVVWSAQAHA